MAGPEHPKLTREQLLAALDQGWGQYLARWEQLSDAAQAQYLQAQGYPRLQDLLAHVCGWTAEGIQAVEELLEDRRQPRPYDIDAFNAASLARYQDRPAAEMTAEFTRLTAALRAQISGLPDHAFDHQRIYNWLFINAVDHHDEHRLPNAPAQLDPPA
jgi:hypothetical protein